MKAKFGIRGLPGVLAIALMIGVAFVKQWHNPWLYFSAAVLFYCGAVIAFSVWQDEEISKQDAPESSSSTLPND